MRKLCDAMDTTFNEMVSLDELKLFIATHKCRLPITDDEVALMFKDAASGRGYLSDKASMAPLTQEEVASAVRGRHKWNVKTKKWEITYRPYRDHWIALLLIVNEKIFALPSQQVIPSRIKAQYEIEEEHAQQKPSKTVRSRTSVKNLTVRDIY